MTSEDPAARAAADADGPAVFSTAHLVWLDLESGDELSIEIIGPQPFLEDLMAQGFAPRMDQPASGASHVTTGSVCRIEARIGLYGDSRHSGMPHPTMPHQAMPH
jgi:hypothetical protein